MTIPAASGYPQYSGTPLIPPQFHPRFLMRAYEATILKDIATTKYNGALESYGDSITFMREPSTVIHRYQKNIRLKTDTPEVESTTMVVDEGFYWNYKLDRVDQKQIRNWDELTKGLERNGGRAVGYAQEKSVLAKMVRHAAPYNKGINAGRESRNVNLGAIGNPIQITGANLIEFFARAVQVMEEAMANEAGQMFMILPAAATTALYTSPLASAYVTGLSRSFIVDPKGDPLGNGLTPGGFHLMGSPFVPKVRDQTANATCYYIIFGQRLATGYVNQLQDIDTLKSEHFFGTYFRGLSIFGSKPLFPEQIGVAYVRFN